MWTFLAGFDLAIKRVSFYLARCREQIWVEQVELGVLVLSPRESAALARLLENQELHQLQPTHLCNL